MRKGNFFKLLAAFSFLFLTSQVILYKTVYKQSVDFLKPKFHVTDEDKLKLLEIFFTTTTKHNIKVILIEPEILLSVATSIVSDLIVCPHICQLTNVISFGIHESVEKKESLWVDLETDGFTLTTTFVKSSIPLPSQLISNHKLPSHYFLFHSGLVIHLVVFYSRADKFFWSSRLTFEPGARPQWFHSNKLSYGQHAMTYNSLDTKVLEINKFNISVPKNILNFLREKEQSTFVECNYNLAENFYGKYPKDTSAASLHFQKKGRQLLAKAKEILDSMGIKFWLSSGTCLGWYRQCNIIPYSKDIDIGIWIKDYKDGMTEQFEDKGFLLKHQFGRINDSFELSYRLVEVKLDIFFFYEEKDYVWNGGTHAWTGQKYKYIFPKFSLCWTELLELKVRVPCETESYVVANYGENWVVPVKDWQWNKSPPNVKENGIWPTKEWDTVIQVYE